MTAPLPGGDDLAELPGRRLDVVAAGGKTRTAGYPAAVHVPLTWAERAAVRGAGRGGYVSGFDRSADPVSLHGRDSDAAKPAIAEIVGYGKSDLAPDGAAGTGRRAPKPGPVDRGPLQPGFVGFGGLSGRLEPASGPAMAPCDDGVPNCPTSAHLTARPSRPTKTSSMCSIVGLSRAGWRYRSVQASAFGGEPLLVRRGEVVHGLHAIACIGGSMHESQRFWPQAGK